MCVRGDQRPVCYVSLAVDGLLCSRGADFSQWLWRAALRPVGRSHTGLCVSVVSEEEYDRRAVWWSGDRISCFLKE